MQLQLFSTIAFMVAQKFLLNKIMSKLSSELGVVAHFLKINRLNWLSAIYLIFAESF
jgi:predicted component of type VI protein secretion system